MSKEFFTVDCHCHLYRNEKQGWNGRAIYDRMDRGGTLEQLTRYMDETGVDQSWVINAWPTQGLIQAGEARIPKDLTGEKLAEARAAVREEVGARLARANDWLCSTAALAPGRVVPLIGMDPFLGAEWMVREMEDKYRKGARGIKLIATWGEFYPNDKRMWPLYQKLIDLDLVILSHSGASNTLFAVVGTDYASPRYWAEPLAAFPKLKLVLAHLGFHWAFGYGNREQDERLELCKKYPNVYFDLSQNLELGYSGVEEDMIRRFGAERLVWASDWHTHCATFNLQGLRRSKLSAEEKRMILGENARRLTNSKRG
ncbi:MAG: amidohydrolase [Chloroflexi bacterium]|nr:amidohydrolase [Chloroflexota bacterium]